MSKFSLEISARANVLDHMPALVHPTTPAIDHRLDLKGNYVPSPIVEKPREPHQDFLKVFSQSRHMTVTLALLLTFSPDSTG